MLDVALNIAIELFLSVGRHFARVRVRQLDGERHTARANDCVSRHFERVVFKTEVKQASFPLLHRFALIAFPGLDRQRRWCPA